MIENPNDENMIALSFEYLSKKKVINAPRKTISSNIDGNENNKLHDWGGSSLVMLKALRMNSPVIALPSVRRNTNTPKD